MEKERKGKMVYFEEGREGGMGVRRRDGDRQGGKEEEGRTE